ncbi:MAG: 1-acyl-sn-glycerol-3-phosphate acyltransferase [Gemmatimonadetes bacterium]|nr:1-acyl-sn-glycerol-3-phosphate acyltransferase [Gemmatimonadota bacterium]
MLYSLCSTLARLLWRVFGDELKIRGLENLPRTGPFFLIANHQSIIDPILVQAHLPRVIYTMAKSTQFASPIMGWLMPRIKSFPVRRFEIDPQAVRFALRRIAEGEGVGIYIEGERSWDGRLQPLRLGTIRLLLKAGVPVIPCTIQGSYDVWPRWARAPRPAPVSITLGPPLRFPRLDDRRSREPAVPVAAETIMAVLRAQLEAAGQPAALKSLPPKRV